MSNAAFPAVMHLLRVQAVLEERFSGELGSVHGLSLKEALLLMHLQSAPLSRLSRVELSKRLYVSPSTVTRMAAPLEKTGRVTREVDPRDARLAYVTLSADGLQVISEAKRTLVRLAGEVFKDRWADGEILNLSNLLARLTASQRGNVAESDA